MKLIPLTQGQFAKVSDMWFEKLNRRKWQALWNKSTQSFYAVRKDGLKTIYMHREVMSTPDSMLCDHQDHDTLNNQDYNLRNVTKSQNQMNRRVSVNNKLGEKCINRDGTGFRVKITKDNKKVFYKWFKTIEEAKRARNEAIKIHHGEFANLYSPEP